MFEITACWCEQEVLIDILEEGEDEEGEGGGASPTRVHVSLTAAATEVAVAPELPAQLLGRGGADADGDEDEEQQPAVGCPISEACILAPQGCGCLQAPYSQNLATFSKIGC